MHFYSGLLMYFCSGVDTVDDLTQRWQIAPQNTASFRPPPQLELYFATHRPRTLPPLASEVRRPTCHLSYSEQRSRLSAINRRATMRHQPSIAIFNSCGPFYLRALRDGKVESAPTGKVRSRRLNMNQAGSRCPPVTIATIVLGCSVTSTKCNTVNSASKTRQPKCTTRAKSYPPNTAVIQYNWTGL